MSQSNIPSLVIQTMLGSSHHNLMIKGTDHSSIDYSSPSKMSRRSNNICLSSKRDSVKEHKKIETLCRTSIEKTESHRSWFSITPSEDLKTNRLSPSSLSTSSASDQDAIDSPSADTMDYSSLTQSIDYLRNEIRSIKLELTQSRNDSDMQLSLVNEKSCSQENNSSETMMAVGLLDGSSNGDENTSKKEMTRIESTDISAYQKHHDSAELNALTIDVDNMRVRVRELLKQTSKNRSPHQPLRTDRNNFSYEIMLNESLAADQSNQNLEIMELDLDGDLLSIDMLNRTPKADVQLQNYAHKIFKAESNLSDDIILNNAPIAELQFINANEAADLISHDNHEQDNGLYPDYEVGTIETLETDSGSITNILLNTNLLAVNSPMKNNTRSEMSFEAKVNDVATMNRNDTINLSNTSIADELDEILGTRHDNDERSFIDKGCREVGSFYTEPSFDLSSSTQQKSVVRDEGKQPNVLTRELIFERECSKKWQPHLFNVINACARCISTANESSVTEYVLLGRSKDIKCTTGGCSGNCPYFHACDGSSNVRLCQKCFDFLHFNPFSLYRQSIKSKELPGSKRKSPYRK